jgi:hypothetical protein
MMDEISKGFFWIPDFRHISVPDFRHVIWQALRLSLYVSKSGPQICTARKFVRKRACGGGRVSTQSAVIEKYRAIAIKNVLDEFYRKLNLCLKLKDGQSKALNNVLDGNDVFAV